MERKFLDFSLPGSECSTERKFHGSESSLYGLFDPGNESAEERKGQLPVLPMRPRPIMTNSPYYRSANKTIQISRSPKHIQVGLPDKNNQYLCLQIFLQIFTLGRIFSQ